MQPYERLIKYVQINTMSDDTTGTVPSTKCQFDLGRVLVEEMLELGIADARMDDRAYVYGTIPATPGCEDSPAVGFIAHLDTIPDFPGEHVHPVVHENYDGEDVDLGAGRVLETAMFPHLKDMKGRTLITTDGTTVLGADDKAGIANIMTVAERILADGRPHGKVCIAFTPDEEIGGGAEYLDLQAWGADFAYTADGGAPDQIEYENFNAASAAVTVNGVNIHPGSAKDKMKNASLIAIEYNALLPAAERPEHTEGYEGFFHMMHIEGDVEKAEMRYIIRDHDAEHLRCRKETMEMAAKRINEKYGEGTVELQLRDSYRNMAEIMREHEDVLDYARQAIKAVVGYDAVSVPIRGGTDGAQLTYRGLPCPNIGTGGYAYHGPYEHCTAEGMEEAAKVIEGIIAAVANV